MPHMKSFSGFLMVTKYVKNWYLVLAIFANLKESVTVEFRDGTRLLLNKQNYQDFYERIYRYHCISNGLIYHESDSDCIVSIPNGISLRLIDKKYSHVIDEIFVEHTYDVTDVNSKIIIDIGASIGDSAIYFASKGATVYAYEPDALRYENAMYNISLNNLQKKITLQRKLIDSTTEIEEICSANANKDVFVKMDCEGCEHQVLSSKPPKMLRPVFLNITANQKI